MSAAVSARYTEDGQAWLRVSPGHAISEQWLDEHAPDLYARWWDAASPAARDKVAREIEQRLDQMEAAPAAADLAERVARYEADAEQLGQMPLSDPRRIPAQLRRQALGAALAVELAAAPDSPHREQLALRLDAADLVADRPVVQAFAEASERVTDRLAVSALRAASVGVTPVPSADRIREEMIAEDPHAALRADVLLAVTGAAGADLDALRYLVARRGVELADVAPTLIPPSEFYAHHATAINAHLDRQIIAGGHRDLQAYIVSWRWGGPASASLRDLEWAIAEHVVADVIADTSPGGRDLHDAQRMWDRAADRAALRELSGALERGELELAPPPQLAAAHEQQRDLGLHIDDDIDIEHEAEQEVG